MGLGFEEWSPYLDWRCNSQFVQKEYLGHDAFEIGVPVPAHLHQVSHFSDFRIVIYLLLDLCIVIVELSLGPAEMSRALSNRAGIISSFTNLASIPPLKNIGYFAHGLGPNILPSHHLKVVIFDSSSLAANFLGSTFASITMENNPRSSSFSGPLMVFFDCFETVTVSEVLCL